MTWALLNVFLLGATLVLAEVSKDFVLKEEIRCNGHYRVATWDADSTLDCQQECAKDAQCAFYSLELKNAKGCFLFDNEAKCSSSPGWVTGIKDTRCATGAEGSEVMLACPFGLVITEVVYASFGTPSGSCGEFETSFCHMNTSQQVVEDLCLGENSCSVMASPAVFGEPCAMVGKNLRVQVKCGAGDSFNEDVYFNAWSSRFWPEAEKEVATRQQAWKEALASTIQYPESKFDGRGIIIVAGGKYLQPALIMIEMLRDLGCNLRIQIWHVGSEEMTNAHKKLLEPFNVETRDFEDFVSPDQLKPIVANVGMRLFQLKPLALLHSDLADILLLDSDNCPIKNPEYLFESEEFQSTGTIFWPDFWKTSKENPIWEIIGYAPTDGWEQESGQLMINKEKSWKALNLAVHFNNEFYMKLLNGDKDTFRFAWMASQTDFIMVNTWPVAVGTLKELHSSSDSGFCGHTMLQHDLQGNPIFVHHNQIKTGHLPVGQNFQYQKSSSPGDVIRAYPVAGLKLPSGETLSCTDIRRVPGGSIQFDQTEWEKANLYDFEVKYFAIAATISKTAFEENSTPQLSGSENIARRSLIDGSRFRRSTCNSTQFLLQGSFCEVATSCAIGETQVSALKAASDRECQPATIPGKNSGTSFTLTYMGHRPANPDGPYYRFGSAYSEDARIGTTTQYAGTFKSALNKCQTQCLAENKCQGIFVYAIDSMNYCNLLRYLGTRQHTSGNNQSWSRSS